MDRQQIGLKLAIDALGLPLRLQTFDDRLILQKTVCLLQAGGVKLGYPFNWYLRGPYSPSLTRDAFAIVDEAQGDPTNGWSLDPTSRQVAQRLAPLFRGITDRSGLANKLERLASMCFLLGRRIGGVSSRRELQQILRKYGKTYSDDEISAGLEELKSYGLWSGHFAK